MSLDNPSAFVERCEIITSREFSIQPANQSDFSQNVGTDTTMLSSLTMPQSLRT
jgi:hypothetical protein